MIRKTAAKATKTPAVMSMVTELGRCGIRTNPINTAPATLPSVLMAVSRPMLVPTFFTDWVSMRTRNGPVIASNANGTRNKNAEDSSAAHSRGNLMSLRQSGLTIGTVAHR